MHANGLPVPRAAAGTIVHRAVARLADDTVVIRQAYERRPGLVVDALLDGAAPEQVAKACGMEITDLRAVMGRWATIRRERGLLTDEAYTRLLNVVFGPAS